MCGLMSDLVILQEQKRLHGNTLHQMSSLRPGVIKQHKTQTQTQMDNIYNKTNEIWIG